MSAMKKIMIFSAPILIAVAVWFILDVVTAVKSANFLSAFEKIHETKPPLTVAQVESLMGRPVTIEQSETADQTITAEVYHYPHPEQGQDFKVIFVNGVVFGTQFVPLAKS